MGLGIRRHLYGCCGSLTAVDDIVFGIFALGTKTRNSGIKQIRFELRALLGYRCMA